MLIFAHRGLFDRKISENTLTAFQHAVAQKVDGIEFDIRVSRDGVPVVIHDETLDRIAGDARRVRDLTAQELQELALRGNGSIPTLNDVTASVLAPVWLDIEIKDREALPLLITKLKTSSALRERVVVSSFVADDLLMISEALPDVKTLLLLRTWPLPFRGKALWQRARRMHVWAVGLPVNVMRKKRMDWLRKQGWKVAAWDLQPLKREARKLVRLAPDIAVVFKVQTVNELLGR